MLVLALSLTISFHRPPLLILLGLLVYSQSFVRSQPSKLFFTTPSFLATIIHPITQWPTSQISARISAILHNFGINFTFETTPNSSQDLILTNFLQQSRKFIQEFSWYIQDPIPTRPTTTFSQLLVMFYYTYRFRVFTSTKWPNSHKTSFFSQFLKRLKKKRFWSFYLDTRRPNSQHWFCWAKCGPFCLIWV
jgi:hypothetical protein